MSDTQTLILTALAIIDQAAKSIAAANEGDLDKAKAQLQAARTRYDQALAGWDAAGGA